MATQSFVDLGAVQRIESGSPTAGADYVDIGAAQREEVAAQYAYPIADLDAGAWLPSTGSDLFAMVDELVTPVDSDYIYVLGAASTAKLQITSLTDPVSSSGHVLHYRAYSSQAKTIQVDLYSGATLIKSTTQKLTTGAVTYDITLSGAEADAITDYSDLEVWLTSLSL
jgi:hypothetical protein